MWELECSERVGLPFWSTAGTSMLGVSHNMCGVSATMGILKGRG